MKKLLHIGLGCFVSFLFMTLWPNVEYWFAEDLYLWEGFKKIIVMLLAVVSLVKIWKRPGTFLPFYFGAALFALVWTMAFSHHVAIIMDGSGTPLPDDGWGMEGVLNWLLLLDVWVYYCLICFAACLWGVFSRRVRA